MKTIIAGSRTCKINDVIDAIKASQKVLKPISEVVSGCAKGADTFGELIADHNEIPVMPFPAFWDDLDVIPCKIKYNRSGKSYNALAGFNRNEQMAEYAEQLIAVWDGNSKGTKDMIERAIKHNLDIFIWDYTKNKEMKYGTSNN